MTNVTQTEAFAKLDEGTVKDFITKVQKYIPQIGLNFSSGCTKWSVQVMMMARVAAELKVEIAQRKEQEPTLFGAQLWIAYKHTCTTPGSLRARH